MRQTRLLLLGDAPPVQFSSYSFRLLWFGSGWRTVVRRWFAGSQPRIPRAGWSALSFVVVWLLCQVGSLPPAGPVKTQAQTVAASPPGELWLLAIGVSRYAQPELRLRFAAADARAIAAALERQAGGSLYRTVHTRVLLDEEVTREAIIESMTQFLGSARPNDVAVLFLAGHGVQDRSTGSYYFLPATATTTNYASAGLRMTDLDEMLRVVRRSARAVLVMLDTCHAGAVRAASPHLEALDDPAARLNTGEGFFLLAASKPGEESEERADLQQGAFTYAILQGLAGAADIDGNREITVTELFGYVTRTVASLTNGRQHPYSKVEGSDFTFAAVRLGSAALPTPARTGAGSSPDPFASQAASNSVAVLTFQNLRSDPQHDWVGVALRTAFNTELSKVKALQVYAPELIDRALAQRSGDLLGVARQLGIERLVTGSFSIVGNEIRIDAHIVYSRSGLQEGSDSVQGSLDDFFTLQRQLVFSLLRRMHIAVPAETGSGSEKSNLDALRLLLESEGELEPRPSPARPATPTAPRRLPRKSSLWQQPWRVFGLAAPAWAEETPAPPLHEALAVLEQYRRALSAKDLEAFARLYVDFPADRRATLARYLDNAADLQVEIEDVWAERQGEELVVSFLRRDKFVDRQTGKPVTLEVRLTRRLVFTPRGWLIAGKP